MSQLTRKAANARVLQLEAQLKAANGETRKNMRARLARLVDEAKKAKEEAESAMKQLKERESSLKQVAQAFEGLPVEGTAKEVFSQHLQVWLAPQLVVPSAVGKAEGESAPQ